MVKCEFCQGHFANDANLKYHQNHAKSCLTLQGRTAPDKPMCRYCGESYSTLYRVRSHEEKCERQLTPMAQENARLREENARLREENIKYQSLFEHSSDLLHKQLVEMNQLASKRSKITHTTIYNQSHVSHNHLDLSNTAHIQSKLAQHLDHATIAQGQVGIARSVVKNILTTDDGELLYVCTDQDRHIFRYLNHEGKEVKDIRAGNLKEALDKSGIGRMAVERGEELWTKADGSLDVDKMMAYHPRVVEIGSLGSDEYDHRFRNELARLTTVPTKPTDV